MWTNNKQKSKYALVLVCLGPGYARGTNATINALDYYGNKLDLHLLYEDMPIGYIEELKKTDLNYRIVFQPIEELRTKLNEEYPDELWKDAYHIGCYIRHWYFTKIKNDYKVTGLIESDAILLNNITPWFELAEGTDYLLTAYHSFQSFELENYEDKDKPFVQPLYIHPLICDPKKWEDMFKLIMKKGSTEHLVDMMSFNQSVLETGKKDKVIVLPDPQWLGGYIWRFPLSKIELKDNRHYLLTNPTMMRVNIMHGKWYSNGFREQQILQTHEADREVFRRNLELIKNEYLFFNGKWKLKLLPEIFE